MNVAVELQLMQMLFYLTPMPACKCVVGLWLLSCRLSEVKLLDTSWYLPPMGACST